MNRYKIDIQELVLFVAILFFLSGCISSGNSPALTLSTIESPKELASNLSQVRVFFSKNQNDKTIVHTTTLNREYESTIILENEGGNVKLSRSGSYLTYRFGESINGDFHSGIWIRDLKEEEERQVILWPEDNSTAQLNNPDFFPEEDQLIFSITWYETDTVGLATVKLDGTNLQVIGLPQGTLNEGPKISPDGENILVLCSGIDIDSGQPGFMLCIMDNDGSERIQLTKNGDSHGTGFFTPDSEKIIYTEFEYGGFLGLFNRPYYQIKVMDIDGSNKRIILDWKYPIHLLGISDDGEEIILMDESKDRSTNKIYVIDIKGMNLRHLRYFDDFLADWTSEE